eukprot:2262782-Alexandrium_andersonii.AAC.1
MEGGRSVKDMAMHFLLWVAWVVETGPLWNKRNTDASVAAPVPAAAKRARRLDPDLGHAVAASAGERSVGRTSGQVMRHMARKLEEASMYRYLSAGQALFGSPACKVISVSFDATRLNLKDTLSLAMFSPDLGLGMWCPPQALGGCLLYTSPSPRD